MAPDPTDGPPPASPGRGVARREFLSTAGVGVVGLAVVLRNPDRLLNPNRQKIRPPFTLGVASGDPLPHAVVLWTRLAPDPDDPTGGMGRSDVTVRWEVATDERMRTIVRSGRAVARAGHGHSVHVDVRGLDAARTYWYRFRARGHATEPARTRTAPAAHATPKRLSFAQVSCQRIDSGYYTAYADLAQHHFDAVIHLGDYIYESSGGPVRAFAAPEPVDLSGYRLRYAHYKQDLDLQAAHAVAPWIVTWDDHEVENNYTGDAPEAGSNTPDRTSFLTRRAAAYRAWWEHQPVRLTAPTGPNLRIFRQIQFGKLADLHVLDTRQYRTDQSCNGGGDIGPRCDGSDGQAFTVLGRRQERWLGSGLRASTARWNVLANQIVLQQWRFAPGNTIWNLDQWDGYPGAREKILDAFRDSRATPIVLTGDVHSSWVGNLATDLDDPESKLLGAEFVGPGISSTPSALLASTVPAVVENSPHIQWVEATKCGWVRHQVTPDEWHAEYRLVDNALVEGSVVRRATRWTVDHRSRLSRR